MVLVSLASGRRLIGTSVHNGRPQAAAHLGPRAVSGGAVGLGGGDGVLPAGERPSGAAVGTAGPPVGVGDLLDEVALRVGRTVARAFPRIGHVNSTFLKRTPANAPPRWTTGTGRWVASATVTVPPPAAVKTRPEPVTVI